MSRIGRKPVVVPAGVEVTVDANGVNLNIKTGGLLDVTEEFKYPAMLVYTPNYMNLTESNLKISVDK